MSLKDAIEEEASCPIPGDLGDEGLEANADTRNNSYMIKEIKQVGEFY